MGGDVAGIVWKPGVGVGAPRLIILEKESVDAGEGTTSASLDNLAAAASAKSAGMAGGVAASVLISLLKDDPA